MAHNILEVGGFETQQIVDLGGKSRMTFCVNSGERDANAQYSKSSNAIFVVEVRSNNSAETRKLCCPKPNTKRDELAASTIY